MSFSRALLLVSGTLLTNIPALATQQTDIVLLTPGESKGINFTLDSQPPNNHRQLPGAKHYKLAEMNNSRQRIKVSEYIPEETRVQQSASHRGPLVRSGLLSQSQRQKKISAQHSDRRSALTEQVYRSGKDLEALLTRLTQRPLHQDRYLRTRQIALNTLMEQLGKPYRWGGASPLSGFDCSGLIYFAYKDHIKRPFPRTATGMYHLQDAAAIHLSELEPGDLVFFQIRQDYVDHVGVYLGNNQFIQSPRTGLDIRISKLSDDYWQNHYVGARRVMTPETIR